jgi:putative hydrolase of the HAD superfamily
VIDPTTVDAVVFDMGGVFVIPNPAAVRDGLTEAGFTVAPHPDAYHRAHHLGVRALAGTGRHDEADAGFWRHYDHAYLGALGIVEADLAAAQEAFAGVFRSATVSLWRHLLDRNVEGFRRLGAAGVPLAIVSNNDGTAEQQLLELGICQVGPGPLTEVAIVVDSTVAGIAKPDPLIFAPALAALDVEPGRALYVGDTVHADVRGALAAGMQVVQLDPFDDHVDFDHHRVPDVGVLADLLLG